MSKKPQGGGLDIAEAIGRRETFSHFTPEQLEHLAECLSIRRVPAGTAVLREGESSRDAYLIDRGRISIQRNTRYGLYVLAHLGAGEMFGETAFIDHGERSTDAVAEEESDLFTFDPDGLAAFSEQDQRFEIALNWAFWKSLSAKLRRANDHLIEFFSSAGAHADRALGEDRPPTGSFQVGIAAKRRLFQEQRLSAMEINYLATLSQEKKLDPGEVIFKEGEPGDRMYVVLEGQVRISKYIPGAGEEALAFLERGDYFGEMALIDNQPRSADARAHTTGAVVLAIPRDVIGNILDMHRLSSPRLLKLLCSLIAKRLRELDEKIIGWFMLSGGTAGNPDSRST